MPDPNLLALVVELFRAISSISGYPAPAVYPDIHFVPHQQLEARVCPSGCSIRAYYEHGEGVFMDQGLDPQNDLKARSILLHELVHYVQAGSGRYDAMPQCQAWHAREIEAYRIQNEYLRRQGSDGTHYVNAIGVRCD